MAICISQLCWADHAVACSVHAACSVYARSYTHVWLSKGVATAHFGWFATQFCAIGVWYKPRHIETTHVACTCMHTSYACTQMHMHFDINSCLVACAYTWTSIAHSISGSANWTSDKNTFQHAIVTIMQHTISQLTCVTDNCTTHNECMLHTMFIYCSHILFKPIVILSFVVLPSWNATCVAWKPNSGQEALAVHFFGGVKFAMMLTSTKIYLMTRSFPFCATSAIINLQLAGSKVNWNHAGHIGATLVWRRMLMMVNHMMTWLFMIWTLHQSPMKMKSWWWGWWCCWWWNTKLFIIQLMASSIG